MRSWNTLVSSSCSVACVLAGLLVCLSAGQAAATTMTPLDLPALTERAEDVIAGQVTATRSAWTASHDSIYTEVTIHVDRVLAGGSPKGVAAGQEVVVRREGGTVDGIGMKVFGAASFAKDEDVVLFLEHRGANRYVVGMAQGKLSLYRDASGVRRFQRDLSELAYTRATTPAERKLSTAPSATRPASPIRTLDELSAEVARLKRDSKRP